MEQAVIMSRSEFDQFNQRLKDLEELLRSLLKNSGEKKAQGKEPAFGWIPLGEALQLLGIDRRAWNRYFKSELPHRKFGSFVWIHRGAMEKWMSEKVINRSV
jgi:hypothetical protein